MAAKRVTQTREEKNARNAAYMRLYREQSTPEEKEKLRAYLHEWHKQHITTPEEAEKYRVNARKYYAENREERVTKSAEWREKNREQIRAAARQWQLDNPEHKAEKDARHYAKYRERIQAQQKECREATQADPRKRLLALLKNRRWRVAKKAAGREFDDAIFSLADNPPTHCPCCGNPLVYARRSSGFRTRSPSLDRVNNALGYVPGNVRVICYRCNVLKSDASIEEVTAILAYMTSYPTVE